MAIIPATYLPRRGTAAQWASANPVVPAGEMVVETDTLKVKVGDGSTHYSSLAYLIAGDADTLDGNHASAFAVAAKGVTNGDSHDHAGGDGAQVDHGGLAGLSDSDHAVSALAFSATDKIAGRATAGAGAGEEITCTAAARSILDDATTTAILATLGGAPIVNPVYWNPPNNVESTTLTFAASGDVRLLPFCAPFTGTLAGAIIMTTAAAAAGHFYLGLYSMAGATPAPSVLLATSGSIENVTNSNLLLFSSAYQVTGGTWYYLGLENDTTTMAVRCPVGNANYCAGDLRLAHKKFSNSGGYGALENPVASAVSNYNTAPTFILYFTSVP